jgi:hypothetical protein
MSGGLAVKTKKRGVVRAGAERLPGPRFLVLTARGPQAPLTKNNSAKADYDVQPQRKRATLSFPFAIGGIVKCN